MSDHFEIAPAPTETCPNCDAPIPFYCDGSGEVICGECGEETGHQGCIECMDEDSEDD